MATCTRPGVASTKKGGAERRRAGCERARAAPSPCGRALINTARRLTAPATPRSAPAARPGWGCRPFFLHPCFLTSHDDVVDVVDVAPPVGVAVADLEAAARVVQEPVHLPAPRHHHGVPLLPHLPLELLEVLEGGGALVPRKEAAARPRSAALAGGPQVAGRR